MHCPTEAIYHMDKELDLAVFVEQAEYLQPEDFQKWVVAHPQEDAIIKKLISPGAKLITGPRGCGKTTILLKSQGAASNKSVLAPYVNFKTSLKLEPLYKKKVNAPFWFLQWMILKVYDGIFEVAEISSLNCKTLSMTREEVKKNIRLIESGIIEQIHESATLNLDDLQNDIENVLSSNSLTRCVLLLDDAAHAFSPEQQEDFFDFFRKIKSRLISPKAAIYPGVTSFSPSFHVGHDAEEISVWLNPSKENYVSFMESLLKKRLPEEIFEKLNKNSTLLGVIIYAANGMPRYLLNMVNIITCGDENDNTGYLENIKFDRAITLKAIEKSYNSTFAIYSSLMNKLPIYKDFVERGGGFFDELISILKNFNKGGDVEKQTSIVGIKKVIEPEVVKVLGFLEYAGLITPVGDSKRGDKGVYELFSLNNSAIIDRNVFFSARSINLGNYLAAFESNPGQTFPRVTTETIFHTKNISDLFELSLPPCQKCTTPRINADAKFCINCGAELTSVSVFDEIVNQDIDVLPLTARRVAAIKKHSKIRKIKDILMDHDRKQLRSVPMIGEIWATRIATYAEEQIA